MSKKEIDIVVAQLFVSQVIRGVVTGGEPLVAKESALYLTRRLREAGLGVTFNSNMTLFDEATAIELRQVGVKTIMTSLISNQMELHDWVTQRQGSWRKVADGVALAKSFGFRILVNTVLTKWNIGYLRQTGDLVGSWGVDKFGATRACAPGPIAPDFRKNIISLEELRASLQTLLELQEKWGYEIDVFEHYPWCALGDVGKYSFFARRKCTAGVTSASIGSNGQLRPCGHSSMEYGNVFVEGLEIPWMRMTDWRKQLYSKQCSSCRHYLSCTGGCAAEAINAPDNKDPHCVGEQNVVSTPRVKKYRPVDGKQRLRLNPLTILRKETFGGIIGIGEGGVTLVDHDAFGILIELPKFGYFTVDEIMSRHGRKANGALELFSRLVSQNLIQRED